jgi:hypothetical protein
MINKRQSRISLYWRSRFELDAGLWASFLVFGWETPLRSFFVTEAPPIAGWLALGLAVAAMITALQGKRRLRQEVAAARLPRVIASPNPLSLDEFLSTHKVREHNAVYLYMPVPKRADQKAAWTWIETLESEGLIKGDPRRMRADYVRDAVKQSHADLFSEDAKEFDVYWVDWKALKEIVGDQLP